MYGLNDINGGHNYLSRYRRFVGDRSRRSL